MKPFICDYCGKKGLRHSGEVNRSVRLGRPTYCNMTCSGAARAKNTPLDQQKAMKADYDREYRAANRDKKLAYAKEWHKANYDPEKAAIERKAKMPYHLEYCRQPAYRAWKAEYDRRYRARKQYGEFAEVFLLT